MPGHCFLKHSFTKRICRHILCNGSKQMACVEKTCVAIFNAKNLSHVFPAARPGFKLDYASRRFLFISWRGEDHLQWNEPDEHRTDSCLVIQ